MKEGRKRVIKILIGISIILFIMSLINLLWMMANAKNDIANIQNINIDGADFTLLARGFAGLAIMSIILSTFILSCIPIALLWGIYGLILLIKIIIKKKLWWIFITFGAIVAFVILGLFIKYKIDTYKPHLDENTIGSIAYDYDETFGYTVYIKENDKYVPYLVLTYDYNKTGNALCLRKNIIGGEKGYTIGRGEHSENEIIYDGWLEMEYGYEYEKTSLDKYLNSEFLDKIDTNLLNKISNTKLTFTHYVDEKLTEYNINRKFFILSRDEAGGYLTYYGDVVENALDYFANDERRIAHNEVDVVCSWWLRDESNERGLVRHMGIIDNTVNEGAKFGVRPAFAISNKSKIKQIYSEELNKEIYVFEY